MKLAIDLSDAQSEALIARAKTLGVAPEDLARAAVADVLASPSEEFRARAEEHPTPDLRRWRSLGRARVNARVVSQIPEPLAARYRG